MCRCHWNEKVVRVTTLVFKGDLEDKLGRPGEYQSSRPDDHSVSVMGGFQLCLVNCDYTAQVHIKRHFTFTENFI